MKKVAFSGFRAMLAAVALSLYGAHSGSAQDVVVTPKTTDAVSTTATGNITDLAADTIFIKADGDAHSTRYSITNHTVFVDDQDAPAEKATVKKGRAVIIYYVMQEGARVATKVVVRNAP